MAVENGGTRSRTRMLLTFILRTGFATMIVGLLVGYSMCFVVPEGSNAVVTRFGDPQKSLQQAGLFWKWPWPIEQSHLIDVRRRLHNTPFTATLTRDRKNVILLSYVVWRVDNPLVFLQSLGSANAAELKLDGMVAASKNFHLGRYDLSALVSTVPGNIKIAEIEQAVLRDVQQPANEKFGIVVEQVGIKRIAYPEENITAVLQQMRAERQAEAGAIRAQGEKEAQRIRDEALVQSEEIRREGREEAGRILGQAEKQAAEIYAKAHQLDPEFYRFWRSLQAVKRTLGAKATVILRTDQGFFDVLSNPPILTKARDSQGSAASPAAEQPPTGYQPR